MFALATYQKIDENDSGSHAVTFHPTREAAMQEVIDGLLSYVGNGVKKATVDDFINECVANGDGHRVEIEGMNNGELIEFMQMQVLGEDAVLAYTIIEVPQAS